MFKKYAIIALGALLVGVQIVQCGEQLGWIARLKAKIGRMSSFSADTTVQPSVNTQPLTNISRQIMDLFARSMASENKTAMFDGGKKLSVGGVEIIDTSFYYPSGNTNFDIEKGKKRTYGFETTISGTRAELSHPSSEMGDDGYVFIYGLASVSNTKGHPYGSAIAHYRGYPSNPREAYYHDKFGAIKTSDLNDFLQLRTDILLAVEKARTQEQQDLIDRKTFEEPNPSLEEIHMGVGRPKILSIKETSSSIVTPEERERREKITEVKIDSRTKCSAPVFYGDGSKGWMRCKTVYAESDLERI